MGVSTFSSTLTFTPPLATSPQQVPFSSVETNVPQSVGTLDIPVGTGANVAIPVPFGTISAADVLVIKNNGNQDIGLRINGIPTSPAVLYQIPPGGLLSIIHPAAPGGSPITSAQIDTTVIQASVVGTVDYYVFGGI